MLEQTDRSGIKIFAVAFGPDGHLRLVEAVKVDGGGSILARMNDRWHIVSGVEGRD